jgi:hypothetical protein
VHNSTFSNNSANGGGGIAFLSTEEGTGTVHNSTFSGNSTFGTGGGIWNGGTLTLVNTILANSTSGGDCFNDDGSTLIPKGVNLVQDGSCGASADPAHFRTGDPLLGPLANNGGPTQTHALLVGSPAIDAAEDSLCPATDQRGVARPQGAKCDIGAFELAAADQMTALGPAQLWVGLKNSDAVGLRLDLKAEVYLNAVKIGEGQLNNVASGSSGFNNAQLHEISLAFDSPVEVPPEAELALTLSVRWTCFGGGHNSGTPRLWFNDPQANSRLGATINNTPSAFFLRDAFALAPAPGSGPKKTRDVAVTSQVPCPNRPFTPFGTWSLTLP